MLVVVVVGSPVVVVVPESNGTKTQGSNTLPHSVQGRVGGGDRQRPSLASGQFLLQGGYWPKPAS